MKQKKRYGGGRYQVTCSCGATCKSLSGQVALDFIEAHKAHEKKS